MSRTLSAPVAAKIATKGAVGSPRHLYRLYLDGGTLYYTDHDEDYTFDGQAYLSRAIKHSAVKTYMENRAEGCTVNIDNVDKAMSAYLEAEDFEGRRIEIDKVFLGLTAADDFIPLFRGEMDLPTDGEQWLTVKAGNISDRRESKSPWRRFGLRCNWDFCGTECGYNSGTRQTGTADSGTATTLVDAALPARAADYWKGATLRILSGTNKGESRVVTGYNDTTKTLTVLSPFSAAIDSTSVYVLECDKTKAACEGFGNQSQFDGFDEVGVTKYATHGYTGYYNRNETVEAGVKPTDEVITLGYGEIMVRGVFLDEYHEVNSYLQGSWVDADRIYAFCEGEVDDIVEVYKDGKALASFNKYLGTTTQSFTFHGETKYYRRTAVIQKLLALEKVSSAGEPWGENPVVTAKIRALKVQKYTSGGSPDGSPAWSDNPAWCLLDFLMKRASTPASSSQIDFSAFYSAAAACTSNGYRVNLVIKKQEKDDRIIERMLTACRGYLTRHGGKLGLHVEQAASAVFTFDDTAAGNDNIKPGSFKPYKKRREDVANRIIVRYTDEQVREKAAVCAGTLLKAATSIPYKFNNSSFDSSGTVYINGEAVTYTGNTDNGDGTGTLTGCSTRTNDYPSGYPLYQGAQLFPELTAIYNDYGHQEKAGKVIEKKLDGTAIPTYKQAADIAEYFGRKAVEGNEYCKLTGFIDSLKLTVGDVVNVTHERRGWVNRKFRIAEAVESMDEEVDYTLQIYDSSFYADNEHVPPAPRETTLPNPRGTPAHVTDLVCAHYTQTSLDGAVANLISVSFDAPTGDDLIFWSHALVIYTTDNWVTTEIHGAFEGGSAVPPIVAQTGKTYKIKAISVSYRNIQADSSTAPEATVNISSEGVPPNITNLKLFGIVGTSFEGRDAKFIWDKTTQVFPNFDPYFKDYMVEIWSNSVKRRTEYVADNLYAYTWEKNYEDHSGSPKRSFTIKVWARDKSHQVSATVASMTVSNPAPAVPGNIAAAGKLRAIEVAFDPAAEADAEGYLVYGSKTSGFTPGAGNLLYKGKDTFYRHEVGADTDTWYYKVAAYDSFGTDSLNYSGQYSAAASLVQTEDLMSGAILVGTSDIPAFSMIPDGNFERTQDINDTTYWQKMDGDTYWGAAQGYNGSPGYRMNAVSATRNIYAHLDGSLRYVPMINNEWFYMRARVYVSPDYDGDIRLVSRLHDKDKASLSTWPALTFANASLSKGAWAVYEGIFQASHANAAYIVFAISISLNATAGYVVFDDVVASRAIDSVVIRNAAIGTAAIDDLSVTGAKIANATIGNAKISDLSADKINAGCIRGINMVAASHMTKGSYLTAACSGGATTLNVKDTSDFPSSGSGFFIDSMNDRDEFSYTGKTATTLTGCSGVLAHNSGAVVAPKNKAMVIADNVNEARFFGDRGDGTIEELANIGIKQSGSDNYIGIFGSLNSGNSRRAVGAFSYSGYGVHAYSKTGTGVYAVSEDGSAVIGYSWNEYGFIGTIGGSGKAPLRLSYASSAAAPTHAAAKGAIWLTSDCVMYVNTSGGTTWQKIGAQ